LFGQGHISQDAVKILTERAAIAKPRVRLRDEVIIASSDVSTTTGLD
jgi:hypothetical protein